MFEQIKPPKLILSYLKEDSFASIEVTSNFLSKCPDDFLRLARLSKIWEKAAHLECISEYRFNGTRYTHSKSTVREFLFIKELQKGWDDLKSEFLNQLSSFSAEELLIQTVALYERFKRTDFSCILDRRLLVQREWNTMLVLNQVLDAWKKNTPPQSDFFTINEFYQKLTSELPPKNTDEQNINILNSVLHGYYDDACAILPEEEISEQKAVFRNIFDFFWCLHSFKVDLDRYSAGHYDFVFIDDSCAELKPTRKIRVIRKK